MAPPKYESLQHYRESTAMEKRAAIVQAALEAFSAQGYSGATLEAIARQAKVSTATLYKHFAGKAELWGGVMEYVWDEHPDAPRPLPSSTPPLEALTRVGHDYVNLLTQPKMRALFRLFIAEAERFPELGQQLYERGKRPFLNRLHSYFERKMREGVLRMDEPSLPARQFLGMINDLVFWPGFLLSGFKVSEREAARVVEEAVKTFLARYRSL
jgi:TetR/AcrR family transcriptional regulator, regulator of autoinduction and epiphytic fitness